MVRIIKSTVIIMTLIAIIIPAKKINAENIADYERAKGIAYTKYIKQKEADERIETGNCLTMANGVYTYNGHRETYYNLNMSRIVEILKNEGIEGEYQVREDGCKMYGDYIMVAANFKLYPRGTIVETSRGLGIVADTGTFVENYPDGFDIAVDW